MSVALPQSRSPVLLHRRFVRRRCAAVAALLTVALFAGAPPAHAENTGEKIIERCTHDESFSGYTQSQYREALAEMEADTEEYGECSQRIRQAQLAAAGAGLGAGTAGGAGGSGAPVATLATPAEQRALAHAQHAAPEPVALGGRLVRPGVVRVDVASAFSDLPSPLLATLAFLLACLLLIGGGALRKRVRGRAD